MKTQRAGELLPCEKSHRICVGRHSEIMESSQCKVRDAVSPGGKKGDSHPCGAQVEVYFRSCGIYAVGLFPRYHSWALSAISTHTFAAFLHFPVFCKLAASFNLATCSHVPITSHHAALKGVLVLPLCTCMCKYFCRLHEKWNY